MFLERSPQEVKRYAVRWAAHDPVNSAQLARTPPVVIISLEVHNQRLDTVTVCPLTSTLHPGWRTRLQVTVGRRDAEIAADQIRTISKTRLGRKIGALSDHDARSLRRIITEMYGE